MASTRFEGTALPLTTATFCAIAESEANAASASSKRAEFKFFMWGNGENVGKNTVSVPEVAS
jgi:hypothetical protein